MKSSLRVAQLAVGDTHFLLLTTGGSVYGMGSCVYGELGLGVVAPFVPVLQRVTRFDRGGAYDENDDDDCSKDGSGSGGISSSGGGVGGGGISSISDHAKAISHPVEHPGTAVYIAAGSHYSAVIVHHPTEANISTGGASTGGTNSLYTFGHGAYYKLGHGM